MANDRIGAAIAAATEPRPQPMVSLEVGLSSGRKIALVVPADMTGQEALELVAAVARDLPAAIANAVSASRGHGLVVPSRGLVARGSDQ